MEDAMEDIPENPDDEDENLIFPTEEDDDGDDGNDSEE